jgi:hypothetical protein
MFRRFKRGAAPARLAKHEFDVFYHRKADIEAAFKESFDMEKRIGIGIAVPPSAAEPWISQHTKLLAGLQAFDEMAAGPLAMFGDHVLYQFRRRE